MLIVEEMKSDGTTKRRGFLNDWELSKKLPSLSPAQDPQSTARQPDRTVRHYPFEIQVVS